MSNLYEKAEKYVEESFEGKQGMVHFKRTVYWLKELKPDADEALQIAAIGHDIERAFRSEGDAQMKRMKDSGMRNTEFLTYHQNKGAELMGDLLKKQGASSELIERVKMLISKHEVGGNDDQNILKDADSVSFFENNVEFFLTHHAPKMGKEKVKEKFDWMFNRITSEKAKQIARKWYEEGINKLEKT